MPGLAVALVFVKESAPPGSALSATVPAPAADVLEVVVVVLDEAVLFLLLLPQPAATSAMTTAKRIRNLLVGNIPVLSVYSPRN